MGEEFTKKLSEMEDIDENLFSNKPWAQHLLNSSLAMTKKAVLNWCNIVVKIGEKELEVEEYVSIFLNQTESLFEDFLTDIETIQEKSLEKIENLLQELQELCKALRTDMPQINYENLPLCDIRRLIQQKVTELHSIADIRLKEVREINTKHLKLCKSLGREPHLLPESPLPLPKETDDARAQLEALENEAMEREERFFQLKEEIVAMVGELGLAPMLDFEKNVLNLTNREVMITCGEMEELEGYHGRLEVRLRSTKEEIEELRVKVDELWNKLETDMAERGCFREKNSGNSIQTLQALRDEMTRLEEMKKANIKVFIQKQREDLEEWWLKCHCTETEKSNFAFFHSQCFNEDLFELHERELDKWRKYFEENHEIFHLLEEHKKLWQQHLELELNSCGANRYKNRGGQLLIEEKQRNKLKKRIPKIEEQLVALSTVYYNRFSRPFLSYGEPIEEYIRRAHEEEDRQFKLKLSAKKEQRELQTTGIARSRMNLFAPSGASVLLPPLTPLRMASSTKRKIGGVTPQTEPAKKRNCEGSAKGKVAASARFPRLNISKERRKRRSMKKEQLKQKLFKGNEKENAADGSSGMEYSEFAKHVSKNNNTRSTGFVLKEHNKEKDTLAVPLPGTSHRF